MQFSSSTVASGKEATLQALCTRLQVLETCVYGRESAAESEVETVVQKIERMAQRLENLEKEVPWITHSLKQGNTMLPSGPSHIYSLLNDPLYDQESQISTEAKIGIIQSSFEDVKNASAQIFQMVQLEKTLRLDVLEELRTKSKEMLGLQTKAKSVEKLIKELNEFVTILIRVYSEQINALSEIFLSMDYFLKQGGKVLAKLPQDEM